MNFEVPENLDCLSLDPQDLREWAATLRERHHELKIGHCTAYLLCAYAENLARAMEYRSEGYIESASHIESRNEALYARIPAKYRW